jgi:tetratricopeptide (TPR) repeat protein/ferredoxin
MPARRTIPHTLVSDPPPVTKPRVRSSKMGKWRALVLVVVHVLIGLHIAHWLSTGASLTPVEPSEAMAFSRSSIVNTGLLFFAAMILLTAIFGRFFCGWGCHVLALQDLCRHWMLKFGITPRPLRSKALMWVPTLAFVYMFLWPALYRLWHGDSFAISGYELTTSEFWATFPGWIVGAMTLLTCGFACVYFLGAKGFCTYACPYGAIFAAADRLAPLRIRVTDACEQCGHCTAVCSSNVRVHEEVRDWGMVISPGCMKCQDCISVCPKGALYYGAGPIPLFAKARPGRPIRVKASTRWGDEALLVLSFASAFMVLRGLYGAVPFLMALGASGVFAYLALTAVNLVRNPSVYRSGMRLKRDGRVLVQGYVFVVATAMLGAILLHSAALRYQEYFGNVDLAQFDSQRLALLAAPGATPNPSVTATAEIETRIDHLLRLESWGLLPSPGNAATLAWLYALTGSNVDSEAFARTAVTRQESIAEMHLLLAHAAAMRSDNDAAMIEWQLAIEASPNRPEAYLALGNFMASSGNIAAAQQVFDDGVAATGRTSSELLYNAGLARALLGETETSIGYFEQALAINPDNAQARENLAGVLASLGRFGESVRLFRTALDRTPDDVATRLLLARALVGLGEKAQAVKELQLVISRDETNAEATAMLQNLSEAAPR